MDRSCWGACMQVGAEFEDAAEAYVRPFLLRGIPSLFSDLKALYRRAAAPPDKSPSPKTVLVRTACMSDLVSVLGSRMASHRALRCIVPGSWGPKLP